MALAHVASAFLKPCALRDTVSRCKYPHRRSLHRARASSLPTVPYEVNEVAGSQAQTVASFSLDQQLDGTAMAINTFLDKVSEWGQQYRGTVDVAGLSASLSAAVHTVVSPVEVFSPNTPLLNVAFIVCCGLFGYVLLAKAPKL
ncbi:hypothetical protein QJQ45_019021 [Haematococcus lacustris]|nr:hypothetical protein QJQ45_019021 [Haematococcus lacustris]